MSASNEKARRANAGRNFEAFSEPNNSTVPQQLNRLGSDIWRGGFMRSADARCSFAELTARATLADRLSVYAAIDPAILAALVGATLPQVARLIEGALS